MVFYVKPITFTNVPKFGSMKYLEVMVSNVGYRPIVLTRFVAFGDRSSFTMGIDDEPAAIFGVEDQRFPTLLKPGETFKIHPLTIRSIERNATEAEDQKAAYDPWKYFTLVDSFGRLHSLDADKVRFKIGLTRQITIAKGWRKFGK